VSNLPQANPRVPMGRLSRRWDGRYESGIRTTQLRFEDLDSPGLERLEETVTVPVPGSICQISASPISSPRIAATAAGTVVRMDSDRLKARTAVDSKVFATTPDLVSHSDIRLGQHAGLLVGLSLIYPPRVGQHVGRLVVELPPRMPSREATALEMLRSGVRPIETPEAGVFLVPDPLVSGGPFRVEPPAGSGAESTCDCLDFFERLAPCVHLYLVGHWLRAAADPHFAGTFPAPVRRRGRISRAYDKAQTDEKRVLPVLIQNLCALTDEPPRDPHKAGRPPVPMADQLFCALQKVHSKFGGRTSDGDREVAVERGLIKRAPRWDVTSRTLCAPETTPRLMELLTWSALPFRHVEDRAAIDSSGFRTTTFHQYRKEKYDPTRKNVWIKGNALVGVRTGIIISAEVTESTAHDFPFFELLLRRARSVGWDLKEVLADKGYQGRRNFEVAQELGIAAIIPFKKNQTGESKGCAAYHKMFLFFTYHREKFEEHYRDRQMVEVTWNSIKARLDETIKSRSYHARVNELLCKFIIHNLTVTIRAMAELDLVPDFLQPNAMSALGSSYAAGRLSSPGGSDYAAANPESAEVSQSTE
jgi:hypothetical protein